MKTNRYNLLIAVVTASVIVMAMKLVGSLLISALIIFPALSAMRMFKSFRAVILASAAVSVLCSSAGILLSILASTPVGATIVCMDIVVFFICSIIGYMMERI
jgi:zinc transport system permease protein